MSLKIDKTKIGIQKPQWVEYISSRGGPKRLHYYEYHINDLSEIGLTRSEIDKSKLQLEEIDKAVFFARKDVQAVIKSVKESKAIKEQIEKSKKDLLENAL